MNRDEIVRALTKLGELLAGRGITGEMYIGDRLDAAARFFVEEIFKGR